MADGEVKIDTKLDTSGLDKGLKDMKNKLDGAGKTLDAGAKKGKGFADNLKGISTGAVAAAGAVAGVAVAVKKTVDVLNDCAAAYRVQKNAEEALQIAAKNNPYLNDESVYNLRNFASELQSLSEIGDEVSLQVMSQLAATGRNEEQIMQIMSAAADMAAVTGQDLASAAQQLNATLNGNAGALGRQIGAINNLTKEELENGKAIELVAKQYKGAAAATADVEVQLSNAWGDFKENIGRGWQNVTQPVKKFFLDVLNDINEATAKTRTLADMSLGQSQGAFTSEDLKKLIDEKQAVLDAALAEETTVLDESQKRLKEWAEFWGMDVNDPNLPALPPVDEYSGAAAKAATNTATLVIELEALKKEYDEVVEKEKAAAQATTNAADAEKAAAQAKRDNDAAAHIAANNKALNEQIEAMRLKAQLTGEEIDAGEMYNAYLNSYIELITKSNGLVTENNQAAKNRLATLQEWAKKAADAATEEERLKAAQGLIEAAGGNGSYIDKYIKRKDELEKLRADLNEDLIKFDNDEIKNAAAKNKALEELDKQYAQNKKNLARDLFSEIDTYTQQTAQVIQDAAALAMETENNRMKAELDNLEIQYRKGELGEEEYQEKVAAAKKKGAKVQYQIEMAQWSTNILTATANTAVGVTQALAQGGVAGIITGALVGAAGAVQLASIMAAKPIPHFATGGFVGGMTGASMGADNTTIAARAGELVVNADQQRRLWDIINGSGTAGGGTNIVIKNSASNIVNTDVQINRNTIELMIDARVNEGLKKGRFNAGLNAAQSSMSGDFYGL